jgi:predicted nucleic acid-binding protein
VARGERSARGGPQPALTVLYADPSALARAYLADEPDHAVLRTLLLEGSDAVVTSDLTRVELASAVRAAGRAGRLRTWREVLERIDLDCGAGGPVGLIALRPTVVLEAAYLLVLEHRLRTLDAIHLAVAVEEGLAASAGEELLFVTRDADQAAAAPALGLAVR